MSTYTVTQLAAPVAVVPGLLNSGSGYWKLAWHPGGDYVTMIINEGVLLFHRDGETLNFVQFVPCPTVRGMEWHPSGNSLALGHSGTNVDGSPLVDGERLLRLVSFTNGQLTSLSTNPVPRSAQLRGLGVVAWNPAGTHIVACVGYAAGVGFLVWAALAGDSLVSLAPPAMPAPTVNIGSSMSLAWSPIGDYLATHLRGAANHLWLMERDGNALTKVAEVPLAFPEDTYTGSALTWSPDGTHLITNASEAFQYGVGYQRHIVAYKWDGATLTPGPKFYTNNGGAYDTVTASSQGLIMVELTALDYGEADGTWILHLEGSTLVRDTVIETSLVDHFGAPTRLKVAKVWHPSGQSIAAPGEYRGGLAEPWGLIENYVSIFWYKGFPPASTLQMRFNDGFHLVGTTERPLGMRTATGWRTWPGDPAPLHVKQRDGIWRRVI